MLANVVGKVKTSNRALKLNEKYVLTSSPPSANDRFSNQQLQELQRKLILKWEEE